ncbi:phage integrase SAM-like domain-containing protein [Parabacteroides merdae]|uniref:phage integrase SAM-like domain-containing protein n=1 Tax=Parabacteroides merdae TaxID=46503 RepID=UPI00319E2815
MGNYFLRTKKEKGTASVYLRVQKRNPKLNILVCSKVSVDIQQWDKVTQDVAKWNDYCKTQDGRKVKETLDSISSAIDNLISQGIYDKARIDEVVEDVVFREERERQRIQEEEERQEQERLRLIKEQEEEARKADVILFLENFLEGIKNGRIKNGAENYTLNTCKVWSNFLGILKRFIQIYPFTWKDINKALADHFVSFMEKNGYMVTSINKYIICFKAMIQNAMDQELHNNLIALRAFSKKKIQETDKAKEIYLTKAELQALYEMPLEGLKDKVRDVFLVGCYTCQRFSDYARLEQENFTKTAKGTKVVRIVQEKTGNDVVIPILNDNLLHIAEKYGYDIPKVNDVILNRYIKQILKELSSTVPSLARKERTLLTMKEREKEKQGLVSFERDNKENVIKPRYELVSSHTARRSGITNLYLSGNFDTYQMMSISGHRDEKTFYEYIKLSSDEVADSIAQKKEEHKNELF